MAVSSVLLGASRAFALLYSCYTSYRVWRPPVSLSGNDDDSDDGDASKKRTKKRVPAWAFRAFFYVGIIVMVSLDTAIFTHFRPSYLSERWSVAEVASLLAMGAGMKLRTDSFKALGEFFTYQVNTSSDQKLVTTGPYARLIHPSYAALVLQRVAFFWYIGLKENLRLFAAYTAFGVVPLTYRMYSEEKEMHAHFGKEWESFVASRWRLIPGVF